jgi:AI-2 transport protein TqsA
MKAPEAPSSDNQQVQTVCLLILALLAVGIALKELRPLLVPFVLAVFLTYCLIPVIDLFKRRLHLPDWVALLAAGLVGVLVLVLVGYLVSLSIREMLSKIGEYQKDIDDLSGEVRRKVPLERLGIEPDESGALFTISPERRQALLTGVANEVADQASQAGLVLIFMVFLLIGRKGTPATGLLAEVEARVKRFVTRIVFFSVLTGVLFWMVLAVFGVPFAMVFGFLAFLLNFIPSLGSLVSTLLPVPVVLLSPMPIWTKVLVLLLLVAVQCGVGVLQPKFVGDSLGLHPVAVVMSLIFFGMIWGTVGAFLAAPMMAVIKIVLERSPSTRPLANLLGGDLRPLSRPDGPMV